MKTFKDFTKTHKYISVVYDQESQKKLREWAEDNGFDLSVSYSGESQDPKDFDFHTTIFYSTNKVNLRNQNIKKAPVEVTITGIKFLGENEDIPVLTISNSDAIKKLREYYEDLGLEDKWPSYQPHITLSYAKQKIDIEDLDLPKFKPKYNRIIVTNLED